MCWGVGEVGEVELIGQAWATPTTSGCAIQGYGAHCGPLKPELKWTKIISGTHWHTV